MHGPRFPHPIAWCPYALLLASAVLPLPASAQAAEPQPPGTRTWDVEIGVRIEAQGPSTVTAGMPVPIDWPEQDVELVESDYQHCRGRVQSLGKTAAMLVVRTGRLRPRETAEATLRYRVVTRPVADLLEGRSFTGQGGPTAAAVRQYLRPSPGIESTDRAIRDLAEELATGATTDLEKAQAFFRYAHTAIEYRYQEEFTSATTALETGIGDCEEKAAVFIVLCRAAQIPARQVWVPEHAWAEVYLVDDAGEGHWLPAHTSGTPWFGRMPDPRVILAKGDRFDLRGSGLPPKRIVAFWTKSVGSPAKSEFIQRAKPAAAE